MLSAQNNMKRYTTTIKTVICLALFAACAFYASATWNKATCNPPECNTFVPINTGSTAQTKFGKLHLENDPSTSVEEGILNANHVSSWGTSVLRDDVAIGSGAVVGTPDLLVSANTQLKGVGIDTEIPGINNSGISYPAHVCADTTGSLVACNPAVEPPPTAPPYFSANDDILIVKNEDNTGDNDTLYASCSGDHPDYPYVIGGGGSCADKFLGEEGMQEMFMYSPDIPGAGYGGTGFLVTCRSNTEMTAYAICSK